MVEVFDDHSRDGGAPDCRLRREEAPAVSDFWEYGGAQAGGIEAAAAESEAGSFGQRHQGAEEEEVGKFFWNSFCWLSSICDGFILRFEYYTAVAFEISNSSA